MRALLIFCLFCFISNYSIGNDKPIPAVLTKKLVLKPKKTPYLITSLKVEKTGTLILMPGVKLEGAKGSTGQFNVYGKIVAGSKKSKRKVEIIGMAHLVFSGADIDINNAVLAGGYMKFLGNCKGTLNKTKLTRSKNSIVHPIRLNAPKSGSLVFTSCEIFDLDIDLQSTKNFPADIPNMSFIKCAFMTPAMKGKNANRPYVVRKMPLEMLAYGNKCDILMKLKFSALNWKLKPPLLRQWYFYDKTTRETAKNTAASNKTFALKISKKPNTKFKAEKVAPKGKKKKR